MHKQGLPLRSNEDLFHLGIKAIIINKEGKILLLKTNINKLKGYKGKAYWDIPGGRIQKGSTIEKTLRREIKEETGITAIKNFNPFHMVLSKIRIPLEKGNVGLILSSYICEVDNMKDIKLSDEHVEHNWFTPAKAVKLLEYKYPKEFVAKLAELI